MKDKKNLYFAYGLVLGLALGFLGFVTLRTTPSTDLPDRSARSATVNLPPEESRDEGKMRALKEHSISLERDVAKLKKLLNEHQLADSIEGESVRRQIRQIVDSHMKEYQALFELTPEQASRIEEWEWESVQFWKEFHAGKRSVTDPVPTVEDNVKEILKPGQRSIYDKYLEKKQNSGTELVAQSMLSQYPATINLSEEQKDELYVNLYYMNHNATRNEFTEALNAYGNSGKFSPGDAYLLFAAKGILSEEQLIRLESYLSAGEP